MADDDKGTKKDAPTGPSKFPDLKEIGGMASKLFGDVKTSITEIVSNYKKKRPKQETKTPPKTAKAKEEKAPKAEASKAPEKKEETPKAETTEESSDTVIEHAEEMDSELTFAAEETDKKE